MKDEHAIYDDAMKDGVTRDMPEPTPDRAAGWEMAGMGLFSVSFGVFVATALFIHGGQLDDLYEQTQTCRALIARGEIAEAPACFQKKAEIERDMTDTLLYGGAVSGGFLALAGGCAAVVWRRRRAQEAEDKHRREEALTRHDFRFKDKGGITVIQGGRFDIAP